MAKQIKYKVKSVSATTEYREVSKEDKQWVLDQVQRINDLADACSNSPNSDLRQIGHELNSPNKDLIRQGNGKMNSVKTLVSGVIDNMIKGSQRDFSNRTCKGLSASFKISSEIFTTVEEVEWIKGDIDEVQAMDTPQLGTTYSDLFDIQTYEVTAQVTVRRIK